MITMPLVQFLQHFVTRLGRDKELLHWTRRGWAAVRKKKRKEEEEEEEEKKENL